MLKKSSYVKLRIAVPLSHADNMRTVLAEAGAGVQGQYSHCSGSYRCTGRYVPQEGATPAIGAIGALQEVEEEVIETLCEKAVLRAVLDAVKAAHPYEEPAIDIMERLELV